MIRSFIAIDLSKEAITELSRIQAVLKGSNADVKWVRPESIHLTLKFLGYVPEEKILPITEKLKEIASRTAPFDLVLADIGVFPSWRAARVIWVGACEGEKEAEALAAAVEEAMALEGFEKEKRAFSAHITLGRARSAKNLGELEKIAKTAKVELVASRIGHITLYKSKLHRDGAEYTPLAVFGMSS